MDRYRDVSCRLRQNAIVKVSCADMSTAGRRKASVEAVVGVRHLPVGRSGCSHCYGHTDIANLGIVSSDSGNSRSPPSYSRGRKLRSQVMTTSGANGMRRAQRDCCASFALCIQKERVYASSSEMLCRYGRFICRA